jgi:membrane-associated PAP2 superfamily phosphatase
MNHAGLDQRQSVQLMAPRNVDLWWAHARWAAALFTLVAAALAFTDWDLAIARSLFFDSATGHWVAAQSFWANSVVHTGGRWAIRALVLVLLSIWALGHRATRLRRWQRPAGYACLAMVLSIALVGALKTLTNVDCPWDLQAFGGRFPFVHLFADRPDGLPQGRCFPAAHAGSGYALVALYFALREHDVGLARWGLVAGLLIGLLFGVVQQARGAHFLSHDVWSAWLAWMTSLSVYAFIFGAKLSPAAAGCDKD